MCLALPGKILTIHENSDALSRTARVDFSGVVRDVNLACVPEARVGQYVLVHVGLALSILDEVEANDVLQAIRQLGELDAAKSEIASHDLANRSEGPP